MTPPWWILCNSMNLHPWWCLWGFFFLLKRWWNNKSISFPSFFSPFFSLVWFSLQICFLLTFLPKLKASETFPQGSFWDTIINEAFDKQDEESFDVSGGKCHSALPGRRHSCHVLGQSGPHFAAFQNIPWDKWGAPITNTSPSLSFATRRHETQPDWLVYCLW